MQCAYPHLLLVRVRPVGSGEEEEGADEEDDVEEGQCAQDVDEVPPQLHVLVVEDEDGDHVADHAQEGHHGHQEGLHDQLEGPVGHGG